MTKADTAYAQFRDSVQNLTQLVEHGSSSFTSLSMKSWVQTSGRMLQRLGNEGFRVIVLGEFKRGKSTFINAMLGGEILPAFATPCTAIINEVKWGEEKKAVLHFRNPLPGTLPSGLPQETLLHIERHSMHEVPPLHISVDDLERFVAIPDPSKDQAASIAESPYDHVEIFWPLPILENGVEIVDSPGLNEHGSRTRVTMDYLSKTDAVLFVFSVNALAGQSEMAVIDQHVRAAGHEHIFFVCNRFDELRRQADRDRVVSYGYEQLADKTAMGRDGIFFVSALDALIGREEGRPDLLDSSKIPDLEDALANFLVKERGRVKLLVPARSLVQGLKTALFEVIPNQRKMLAENVADLEERFAEAQPKLSEADKRRQTIKSRLERGRNRLRDSVRDSATHYLRDIAASIPMWVSELELENRMSAFKFLTLESQIEAIAKEAVAGVTPQIEALSTKWRQEQLEPMLADMMEDLTESASNSVQDLLLNLDSIRADLARLHDAPNLSHEEVSTAERVIAGGVGVFLMGPTGAVEGVTMGYQGVARGLIPHLAIGIAGIFILHLNPVTLIPAMIGAGLFRTYRQGDALTERVKGEIGQHLSNAFVASIPDQVEQMSKTVHDQTEPLVDEIDQGLQDEIQAIRDQVAAVLATKQAGVDEVNRQLETLEKTEAEMQAINTELSNFIIQIAETR